MSDNDLEVVFENIVPVSPTNEESADFREKFSSLSRKSKCQLSVSERAQLIKEDTNAYLLRRLSELTSKLEANKKRLKQLEIRDPSLKLKVRKKSQNSGTSNFFKRRKNGNENTSMEGNIVSKSPDKTDCVVVDSIEVTNNIKLSRHMNRTPKKFSINGSPVNSKQNSGLIDSPGKSQSTEPKFQSIEHTSPLIFTRNKISPRESSKFVQQNNNQSIKRKLNFSSANTSSDISDGQTVSNIPPLKIFDEGYLLRQFKLHIDVVLGDDQFKSLFTEEEKKVIDSFLNVTSDCIDFYARMHNRKFKWNRLADVNYPVATLENMNMLQIKGFFSTDTSNLGILEFLELLKIQELKELCKSLSIKCKVPNKMNLIQEILSFSQTQRTLGLGFSMISSEQVVKERVKKIVEPCFILSAASRKLFCRIHLLFNLKFNKNETPTASYKHRGLYSIVYAGTNKALYPNYDVDQSAHIFPTRDDLLRYELADELENQLHEAMEAKNFIEAESILSLVRENFISELKDHSTSASQQPLSLRKFSPGTKYAYTLFSGVDVLKRLKKNKEAVEDIKLLLGQTVYLPYKRARWYEKLITIQKMAGAFDEVVKFIQRGIDDEFCDDQCWYVLTCRIKELLKRKTGVTRELKGLLNEIKTYPPVETCPVVEIKARALEGKPGYKRVYVLNDVTGDGTTFSSVEECVLSHYCPDQFDKGRHVENSMMTSLFGILFWNIIYDSIPCAFISHYQARPLDLSTGEFYVNRRAKIDEALCLMQKWSIEEITTHVISIYVVQHGKTSIVNWNLFFSASDVVDIIVSIGWNIVLKICERYAKNYREAHSGFPDLFLWTPGVASEYKFVEVKGPNDVLGPNQKLWLDFLVKINANVEVCYVSAHGSKIAKFLTKNLEEQEAICAPEEMETEETDVLASSVSGKQQYSPQKV